MVSKIELLWKQKNVGEKLSKYDSLKEKHDNLCLHTDFVVRKFRVGLSPQSPLDHVFSQVPFYDQARLRIFDSRTYEFNRQSALDVFFKKTPKTLGLFPGSPRMQHTTLNRHRAVISKLLLQKLEENILCVPSSKFLNIDGGTSKSRKGEDFTTSSVSFTVFDKTVTEEPIVVEIFLPVLSRFTSLKKELRKEEVRQNLKPVEEIIKQLNSIFHKVISEKKAAAKLAKCLKLIHLQVVNISNLAGISSDNEN